MWIGPVHHGEVLPPGHRLKRPTKGGANRSRTNNAPPPCENLHARRFLTRTFLLFSPSTDVERYDEILRL